METWPVGLPIADNGIANSIPVVTFSGWLVALALHPNGSIVTPLILVLLRAARIPNVPSTKMLFGGALLGTTEPRKEPSQLEQTTSRFRYIVGPAPKPPRVTPIQ